MREHVATAGRKGRNILNAVDRNGGAGACPVGSGKKLWADGGRPGGYPYPNRRTFGGGTAPLAAKTVRRRSVAISSTASVPSAALPVSTTP